LTKSKAFRKSTNSTRTAPPLSNVDCLRLQLGLTSAHVGLARGCTPRAEKNISGPNLQGKVASAPVRQRVHPQSRARVHF